MFINETNGKNNTKASKGGDGIIFFIVIVAIIMLMVLLIISSKFEIEISNMKFNTQKENGRALNENFSIIISVYILRKIKILRAVITKKKIETFKYKHKEKIENMTNKFKRKLQDGKYNTSIKSIFSSIKDLKIDINKLNLKIEIGTENAALTSILVAVISAIIGIVLSYIVRQSKYQNFLVTPIYIDKNFLKLEFDCIFTINFVNIISIILKRRSDKNVRTPNRRAYGYSYE